jgi:hypothetical protein
MTAVAEFANLSLAEVAPGMLSASDFVTSTHAPQTAVPVMCTPTVIATPEVFEVLITTYEAYQVIHLAVNGG